MNRAIGDGDASWTLARALARVGWCGGARAFASGGGKTRASAGAGKKTRASAGAGKGEKAATAVKTKRKTAAKAVAAPPSVGNRVLPHVSAQVFPLHESVVREAASARVSEAAAAKATAGARLAAAPPPPTSTGNRVLPHVSAQKFPLDASVVAAATSSASAETVLRMPLSTPPGASTPPPAGGDKAGGASRSSVLAALGIVGVAILAMSMNGTDEEDLPPPPRRRKPKNEGAKRDVEVQIEIIKQPDAEELKKMAKSAPVRAPEAESAPSKKDTVDDAKELADAFSATAEFLKNVEVRFDASRALFSGPLLICRGFQYRAGPFTGQN